ncbi:hypothetical protein PG984_015064 [Apiospora sp. TS-2023a]
MTTIYVAEQKERLSVRIQDLVHHTSAQRHDTLHVYMFIVVRSGSLASQLIQAFGPPWLAGWEADANHPGTDEAGR